MTCMWIRVAATWASGRRGRGRGWDTNNSYGFISLNGSMGTSANFYSGPADTNLYINRPTGKDIIFAENNGTGQMTILTGGNVGIGTTSPLSGLHVAGTDKGTTNIYTGGNLNVTATDSMAADKGGSINLGGLVNASSITGYGSIKGAKSNSTSDNYDGYLSFYTTKQTIGSREWMRITADGNVGIGTTSFLNSANLQLSTGSGASSAPYFGIFNTATSPTSAASTRFDLGFLSGTSNYVATSTVLGAINFMGQANDAGYGAGDIQSIVTVGGNLGRSSHEADLAFFTKSSGVTGFTEKMRITALGRVRMPVVYNTTGIGADLRIESDGTLYRIESARRYKEDINYDNVDGNLVYQLKPVSYKLKALVNAPEEIGFIAEDVEEVDPRLVVYSKEGTVDSLYYDRFSVLLVKAVQDLNTRTSFISSNTASASMYVDSLGNIGIGTTAP